ncbi:MAG: dUTP pyrophosphatase [Candidatus Woesearchaeota archaeon]|jgi:dUTP pyrophosphatase|nr:dUTP pyrophosphatase [Candidatus Woesearchaeota archaeon]
MEKPFLKIKLLRENATMPSKRVEDACFDLYGCFDEDPKFSYPGDIYLVPLGISTEFPRDWVFYIVERSGSGSKGISTRAGVIDSGYRGEIKTPLNNTTNKLIIFSEFPDEEIKEKFAEKLKGFEDNYRIYPQSKGIAQGFLLYCPHVDVEEVKELDMNSERGSGGWGSTGK